MKEIRFYLHISIQIHSPFYFFNSPLLYQAQILLTATAWKYGTRQLMVFVFHIWSDVWRNQKMRFFNSTFPLKLKNRYYTNLCYQQIVFLSRDNQQISYYTSYDVQNVQYFKFFTLNLFQELEIDLESGNHKRDGELEEEGHEIKKTKTINYHKGQR